MSVEITYRNGSMDGRTKRVRSMADQPTQRTFVWKEFDKQAKKPTGRSHTEIYVLDRKSKTYFLSASDGICG